MAWLPPSHNFPPLPTSHRATIDCGALITGPEHLTVTLPMSLSTLLSRFRLPPALSLISGPAPATRSASSAPTCGATTRGFGKQMRTNRIRSQHLQHPHRPVWCRWSLQHCREALVHRWPRSCSSCRGRGNVWPSSQGWQGPHCQLQSRAQGPNLAGSQAVTPSHPLSRAQAPVLGLR